MEYTKQYRDMLLESMVERRMKHTGEDRTTAFMAIKKYVCQHLADQLED